MQPSQTVSNTWQQIGPAFQQEIAHARMQARGSSIDRAEASALAMILQAEALNRLAESVAAMRADLYAIRLETERRRS